MASKTLIRTGASLMNRFLSKPFLQPNPTSNHQIVSHGLEITPKLFPFLSNLDTPLRLPQNDAESIRRVFNEGFVHPCGLPYSRSSYLKQGNQGWTESDCSKNSKGPSKNYSLASLSLA